MLEEILSQYKGTLLIVSHDRDFLDQTVTKILAFEGNGKIESCIGGYSDYLEMKAAESGAKPAPAPEPKREKKEEKSPVQEEKKQAKKLTYKLERELSQLPQ
ncbi:MAG TPA: ABC transporter family protein, partial [Rhodospirillaceae bacterium]|nr:ABC transporter family protein [Rhodospirillaceae bacterium]